MLPIRRDTLGDLWQEMSRAQSDFNRIFGRLGFGSMTMPSVSLPALNVTEDENAFYAEIDLPGMDPAKIDVQLTEGNLLTIQGERPATQLPDTAWLKQERPTGQFSRSLTLPALVDVDKVQARMEHGVLRVTLPKSEAAKPRRILVQTS